LVHCYLESCVDAYILAKNVLLTTNENYYVRCKRWKEMLGENTFAYTWLLVLLHLRARWILGAAGPGHCRGAGELS